ncbi:MAG: GTP-binding protein, partial [Anaerolineae bacterium]|nr:GTP-binding protein [Anaerolineae bacterium]
DIIILNKVDLVTPEKLAKLKREWAYPQARIIETTYADVPLELVLGIGKYNPDRYLNAATKDIHVHEDGGVHEGNHDHDDHEHDHSMVFSTWTWASADQLSLPAIRKVSRELPTSIYRAKGILNLAESPDRKAVLQVVGNRVKVTIGDYWGDEKPYTQIVFIGSHGSVNGDKLRQMMEHTLVKNATLTSKLLGSVNEWLRGDGKLT